LADCKAGGGRGRGLGDATIERHSVAHDSGGACAGRRRVLIGPQSEQSHAGAQARDHDAEAGLGGDFTGQDRFLAAPRYSGRSRQCGWRMRRRDGAGSGLRRLVVGGKWTRRGRDRIADDGMRRCATGRRGRKDRCQR